jgi:hypothetical protein
MKGGAKHYQPRENRNSQDFFIFQINWNYEINFKLELNKK